MKENPCAEAHKLSDIEFEIQKMAFYYARGVDTMGNERSREKALEHFRMGFTVSFLFEYFWPDDTNLGSTRGGIEFAEFPSAL